MGALFFIGLAACVLGTLLLVSTAASVHWGWGIACALVPFFGWIVFSACHWKHARRPVVFLFSGIAILSTSALLG